MVCGTWYQEHLEHIDVSKLLHDIICVMGYKVSRYEESFDVKFSSLVKSKLRIHLYNKHFFKEEFHIVFIFLVVW